MPPKRSRPFNALVERPPHPATVVQPKVTLGGQTERPPHPAKVAQRQPLRPAIGGSRREPGPPHPAAVEPRRPDRAAQRKTGRSKPARKRRAREPARAQRLLYLLGLPKGELVQRATASHAARWLSTTAQRMEAPSTSSGGTRRQALVTLVRHIRSGDMRAAQQTITQWNSANPGNKLRPEDLDDFEDLYGEEEGSGEDDLVDISGVWSPGPQHDAQANARRHFDDHGAALACTSLAEYVRYAQAVKRNARHGFTQQSQGHTNVYYDYDIDKDIGVIVFDDPLGRIKSFYILRNSDAQRAYYRNVIHQLSVLSGRREAEVREELRDFHYDI